MGALDRGRPARPPPFGRRVALVARDPGEGAPGRGSAGRRGRPRRRRGPIRRVEAPPSASSRLHRQRGAYATRSRISPSEAPVRSTSPFRRCGFSPGDFPYPGSGSGISALKRANKTARSTIGGCRRGRKGRPPPFPRSFSWTDRSFLPSRARSAGSRPSSREIRIREGRFLGTHVTASLERSEGDVALPGDAAGVWPFPSVEADLFYKEGVLRVRKFKAERDSAALRLSGSLDTRKRIVSAKASGELDIAGWIAAGAPGISYVRRVVREGKAEFSVTADGPWNDPEGAARLVFRNAGFPGAAGAEGEVQLSLRGRVLRLAQARAKLWGGVLEADGLFRTDSGHVEGKASLRRVSLAAVPWKALGVPVSLAGTGDASVRVAGTADRLEGAVSLALPGGIERISSPGESGPALRFPISLEAGGSVSGGQDVTVDSFRLLAGKAESRGDGEASIAGRDAPPARFAFPPRREGGRLRRRRTSRLGKSRRGVGNLRSLVPPARESVFFRDRARDSRASLPSVAVEDRRRAVGGAPCLGRRLLRNGSRPPPRGRGPLPSTRHGPLRNGRSRCGRSTCPIPPVGFPRSRRPWERTPAGRPAISPASRGKGKRTGGSASRRGRSKRRDGSRPRASTSAGSRCGHCGRRGSSGARDPPIGWDARAEGKFGDGAFHVAANGDGGNGTGIEGKVEGIEIAQVFSLLRRDNPGEVKGAVDAGICGPPRSGRDGKCRGSRPGRKELSVGPTRFSGVRAEGRLGAADGTFSFRSASPQVRIDARGATLRRVADESVADRVGGPHVVSPRRRGAFRGLFRRRVERRGRRGDPPGGHRRGRPPFPGALSRPARIGAGDESFRRRDALRGVSTPPAVSAGTSSRGRS